MLTVVKPLKRNRKRLLDFVINELVENDFSVNLYKISADVTYGDSFVVKKGTLVAYYEGEGFYKSTGMVTLIAHEDKIYCRQRYDEITEFSSFDDFGRASFYWYQFSHDRLAGWSMPAESFADHYNRLDLKLDPNR